VSKSRLIGPIIAVVITIAFVGWMWSGSNKEETAETPTTTETKSLIARVQFVPSVAQSVQRTLTVNGVAEAIRNVTVFSEASGKLTSVNKAKGDRVARGDIIARIDLEDLPARIRQAEAFQEQTRLEYQGAQKLFRQGLINEANRAAALTSFEQAKAQLATLQVQQDNRTIRAPIAGRVENSDLQVGALISNGSAIADIYDYSQLKFVGSVAEKDIALVQHDQAAQIHFKHGDTANAKVSYIGSVTNPATRTFTVELAISSVEHPVSGVTAEATIDVDQVEGHYISPALLTINKDGVMGLKVLDENNQVQFRTVEILRSDTNGVWISGLGEMARIITVGQGFVNIGEKADPTEMPFDADIAVGL
jgi:membrane fusion protein, multidrug efflux system